MKKKNTRTIITPKQIQPKQIQPPPTQIQTQKSTLHMQLQASNMQTHTQTQKSHTQTDQAVAVAVTISDWEEISKLVDETLIKKERLDRLETTFSKRLNNLACFYVKMLCVADRVYQHLAWTVFNYNSELYHIRVVTEQLFKLLLGVGERPLPQNPLREETLRRLPQLGDTACTAMGGAPKPPQRADYVASSKDLVVVGTMSKAHQGFQQSDYAKNHEGLATIYLELAKSISDDRIENALKIRIFNFLIKKGVTVTIPPKIKLDEHVFEMAYVQLSEARVTETEATVRRIDQMLVGLYKSNYNNNNTEGGTNIVDILDKTGASNPVFKTNKEKTVTYLAHSEVDLKHYGDYLVIVLATLILFDCGEFIGTYLAMERNAEPLIRIFSRIGMKSCDIVLRKIDQEYQTKIFDKLGGLLFYKSWANYQDILNILKIILSSPNLVARQKIVFYARSLECLECNPKYTQYFEQCLASLLDYGNPECIVGIRNILKDQAMYLRIDQFVRDVLTDNCQTPINSKSKKILASLLIRNETMPLLDNVSRSLDDLDSLPNLLQMSQAISGETTFLICDKNHTKVYDLCNTFNDD